MSIKKIKLSRLRKAERRYAKQIDNAKDEWHAIMADLKRNVIRIQYYLPRYNLKRVKLINKQ